MSKNKLNNINNVSKTILWILGILFVLFFGIFVYTPEYNGTEGEQNTYSYKGLKIFLNTMINIPISRIMLILITILILFILAKIINVICEKFFDLGNKLKMSENENLILKEKLDKHLDDNIEQDKKAEIIEKMKLLIINFPDIISIQIYECTKSKKNSMVEFEVKPTKYYYTKQNEVANLINERYHISESLINEYQKIKDFYNNGNYDELEKYIKKLIDRLNNKFRKNPNNITDSIINDYSLLTLALQLDFNEVSFTIDELDTEFEKKINNAKRNGFLRGIIENTFYKFVHNGDSNKGKRIYITRCLDIENIPHMFVIVLQPSFQKNNYFDEVSNEIGETFYNMLENDLNLVYNDIKVS